MLKSFFATLILSFFITFSFAQTREALEKQRLQLRKEIEETEKQLRSNKAETKTNLREYNVITRKVNLQDRLIDNINRDLTMLNNNMYTIQRDIFRYDRILDTLKREYGKSMVYAYKNRSNYEFLNFIFSASSFNDAIKRITYLKSYRNYREIKGENILRTQELRRNRVEELSSVKKNKNQTLQVQSKELEVLAQQQNEKDRILAELKKQGKTLNKEIAAKQKQMRKVNDAISAAIAKALKEAQAEANRLAREKEKANPTTSASTSKPSTRRVKPAGESVLLNPENLALNASFERNKGTLPWPLDRGSILMHYGSNKMPSGSTIVVTCVTIASDIGTPVKCVFDGTVSVVKDIDDIQMIVIQHGRYFTTYSNLSGVNLQKGQDVKTGQTIGRVAANFDGIGAVDFFMSNEKSNFDPESWLRRR